MASNLLPDPLIGDVRQFPWYQTWDPFDTISRRALAATQSLPGLPYTSALDAQHLWRASRFHRFALEVLSRLLLQEGWGDIVPHHG